MLNSRLDLPGVKLVLEENPKWGALLGLLDEIGQERAAERDAWDEGRGAQKGSREHQGAVGEEEEEEEEEGRGMQKGSREAVVVVEEEEDDEEEEGGIRAQKGVTEHTGMGEEVEEEGDEEQERAAKEVEEVDGQYGACGAKRAKHGPGPCVNGANGVGGVGSGRGGSGPGSCAGLRGAGKEDPIDLEAPPPPVFDSSPVLVVVRDDRMAGTIISLLTHGARYTIKLFSDFNYI